MNHMLYEDAVAIARVTARNKQVPHAVIADTDNLFYVVVEPLHGWHWLVTPNGHKIVVVTDGYNDTNY